jgi:hypothetical protein
VTAEEYADGLAGAAIADIEAEVPSDDMLALVCRVAAAGAALLEEMLPHDYEPFYGRLEELLKQVVTRTEAGDVTVGVYSGTSVSGGGQPWRRLTWKELFLETQEKLVAVGRWQTICADLDRCEHGRHEGDVCDGCGGPSKGNPFLGENRAIGFGLDGVPIWVPPRGPKNDATTWYRRG